MSSGAGRACRAGGDGDRSCGCADGSEGGAWSPRGGHSGVRMPPRPPLSQGWLTEDRSVRWRETHGPLKGPPALAAGRAWGGWGRDLELGKCGRDLFPPGSPPNTTVVTTRAATELVRTTALSSTATGPTVTQVTAQPTASSVSMAKPPTGWATAHSTEARSPPAASANPTGSAKSKHPAHTFPQRARGLQARHGQANTGQPPEPPPRLVPDRALSAPPQGDGARAPIHHRGARTQETGEPQIH